MKFKVGDKVKAVNAHYGWDSVSKGDIGEITNICNGILGPDYVVDFKKRKNWNAKESDLRLVEFKKTKNQRIAELEEIAKHFRSELDRAFEIEKDLIKRIESLEFVLAEKSKFSRMATLEGAEINIKPFLTPNQQRAEIIEKAKKFVEEHKNNHKFVVQDNLVVAFNSKYDGKKQGYACCNPSDVFNEHIGKAIALGRALGLDVSEFEQAVQPTKVVNGQLLSFEDTRKSTVYKVVDIDSDAPLEILYDVEHSLIGQTAYGNYKVDLSPLKIINDTEAIYEKEVK